MKIGDEVYVHGYVDEIRNDVVIIRNEGGYFGTVPSEITTADRKDEPPMDCKSCKHWKGGCDIDFPICKRDPVEDEPLKTTEYCNYCNHKGCENCIASNLDDYCVPSSFEEAVKDKPQLKEDGELEILTQTIEFPDTHQRFIFTRSICADGDCLIIGDWEYKGKEDEP